MRLLAEVETVWGKIWTVRQPSLEDETDAVTEAVNVQQAVPYPLSLPVRYPSWLQSEVAAKASEAKRIKPGQRMLVTQN